jgi:hypothetical protein
MSQSISDIASRPVSIAIALKIAFVLLVADIAVIGGKALLSEGGSRSAAPIVATLKPEAGQMVCREVSVKTDEGYGLRGQKTRVICSQAL